MSLILCPECKSKISNKAKICPQCGYNVDDNKYEIIPTCKYDLIDISFNDKVYNIISYDDNKNLYNTLGVINNINKYIPEIADTITEIKNKDSVMVADMDDYIKKLIDKGIYRFSIDKNGDILPTIRDNSGNIIKQVRLKEEDLPIELSNSFSNVFIQASVNKIIDELEIIKRSIEDIHIELQDDRIALAESAIDKINQAYKIKDSKLKEIAILNAINTATDAKRALIRNFKQTLQRAIKESDKSTIDMVFDFSSSKALSYKAQEAFQSLMIITNMVQLECQGYSYLGEIDSVSESLKQFQKFIKDNELDNKDNLIKINNMTNSNEKEIITEFIDISKRIDTINKKLLEDNHE